MPDEDTKFLIGFIVGMLFIFGLAYTLLVYNHKVDIKRDQYLFTHCHQVSKTWNDVAQNYKYACEDK